MKASTLLLAAVAFVLAAAVTFAVVRWFDMDNPEMAFIVGAIIGTQIAAVFHHRTVAASNTFGIKLTVGMVLAITAAILGLVVHYLYAPYKFAEISIPMGTLGALVFPFAIFNTMWSALSKSKKENESKNSRN